MKAGRDKIQRLLYPPFFLPAPGSSFCSINVFKYYLHDNDSAPMAACTSNPPSSRNLSPQKLSLAALKVEAIIYSYIISKFLISGKGTAVQPKLNTPLHSPSPSFCCFHCRLIPGTGLCFLSSRKPCVVSISRTKGFAWCIVEILFLHLPLIW